MLICISDADVDVGLDANSDAGPELESVSYFGDELNIIPMSISSRMLIRIRIAMPVRTRMSMPRKVLSVSRS